MADLPPAGGIILEIDEDGPAPAVAAPADPDVVELPPEGEDGTKLPPRAKVLADGTVELPLLAPVTLRYRRHGSAEVREERVERLVLHRLNGADMRAIGAAKDAAAVVALARASRIGEAKWGRIYDMMDAADIAAAAQVVEYFLANGPRTGR